MWTATGVDNRAVVRLCVGDHEAQNEAVKGSQLLTRRWVVERTISWLNGYRRGCVEP